MNNFYFKNYYNENKNTILALFSSICKINWNHSVPVIKLIKLIIIILNLLKDFLISSICLSACFIPSLFFSFY